MSAEERTRCYVCGGEIRGGALCIGQGLYRHPVKCAPGSARYMRRRKLRRTYNMVMGRRGQK